MSSNTVHNATVAAPFDMQLEIILTPQGTLHGICGQMYDDMPIEAYLSRQRSIAFVAQLLTAADRQEKLIEDVIINLKTLSGFECEVAVLRAIEAAISAHFLAGTLDYLKGRAA